MLKYFVYMSAAYLVSDFGTWGAVGMATFHTFQRTVEGVWVLAGDGTGRATHIIPPLAQLLLYSWALWIQLLTAYS